MPAHSFSRRLFLALGGTALGGTTLGGTTLGGTTLGGTTLGGTTLGGTLALFGATGSAHASAMGFEAYAKEQFEAALKGPKPVLVHVHATWCPTCKKQEAVFNELAKTPEFAKLKAIRVDFDMDGDFKKAHNVTSQSIILVFKGGKEVARSGGVTDRDKLTAIVAEAAK